MNHLQQEKQFSITISMKNWQYFLLGALLSLMLVGGISSCYQGRTISRVTGRAVNIKLPADVYSYDDILSISFHKNTEGETIKDVTYLSREDGKLHSHEYNDWGIFQGEIIWNLRNRE